MYAVTDDVKSLRSNQWPWRWQCHALTTSFTNINSYQNDTLHQWNTSCPLRFFSMSVRIDTVSVKYTDDDLQRACDGVHTRAKPSHTDGSQHGRCGGPERGEHSSIKIYWTIKHNELSITHTVSRSSTTVCGFTHTHMRVHTFRCL